MRETCGLNGMILRLLARQKKEKKSPSSFRFYNVLPLNYHTFTHSIGFDARLDRCPGRRTKKKKKKKISSYHVGV